MLSSRIRAFAIGATLITLTAGPTALAATVWAPIERSGLTVTEGSLTQVGNELRTSSPAMRAGADDGGNHATGARVSFQYLGESTTTVPLGSGLIRRQIGVKVSSADPCNLIYVMWHQFPQNKIQVQVKRNPGQTTSAQCGNGGYTTLANFVLAPGDSTGDSSLHELEVHARREPTGALVLTVGADGTTLGEIPLTVAQSAGLDGPIGVRSDNGTYSLRLYAASSAQPGDSDTVGPITGFDRTPKKKTSRSSGLFGFSAGEADASFECRVDSKPYRACTSPRRIRRLSTGKHRFRVRATDPAGNRGPETKFSWRVEA